MSMSDIERAEDDLVKARLDAFEARREADAETHRQALAQIRRVHEAQRLEDRQDAEAADVAAYRDARVAAEKLAKSIAPQFVPFIAGSTRDEVDASIEQAKAATAEIAGQTATTPAADRPQEQPAPGQYLPSGMTPEEAAKIQAGTYSLDDHARMRDRLGLGQRAPGLFG